MGMSDAEAQILIRADAQYHINKDWGGGSYGGGLMYAIVIAPSGSVYQTRDLDAVLWHCGDAGGNQSSTPILVLCGPNSPPTDAQLDSLDEVLLGQTVYPHSYWSPTACPGNELRLWLEYGGDEMTPEEFERRFLEMTTKHIAPTLDEMKKTYDPIAQKYPRHTHDTTVPKPQI